MILSRDTRRPMCKAESEVSKVDEIYVMDLRTGVTSFI